MINIWIFVLKFSENIYINQLYSVIGNWSKLKMYIELDNSTLTYYWIKLFSLFVIFYLYIECVIMFQKDCIKLKYSFCECQLRISMWETNLIWNRIWMQNSRLEILKDLFGWFLIFNNNNELKLNLFDRLSSASIFFSLVLSAFIHTQSYDFARFSSAGYRYIWTFVYIC